MCEDTKMSNVKFTDDELAATIDVLTLFKDQVIYDQKLFTEDEFDHTPAGRALTKLEHVQSTSVKRG